MDRRQQIILAARPEGTPKLSDFSLETGPVPDVEDGHILIRTEWLSLDPYMRGRMDAGKSYANPVPLGGVMEGAGVGEVIKSRNPTFPIGAIVTGPFGWQSHVVSDGTLLRKLDPSLAPVSTALGVLGMPGITAFVGLNDHGMPKPGETLVVGAATGAVGSVVGQLAKIYGLRVVGVAGGAEKCAYAVDELGFDACLDHKNAADAKSLREKLHEACPDGVDIYFENVAGKTLEAVIPLMNLGGRIPVCGMITWYNSGGLGANSTAGANLLPLVWRTILVNRLRVQGFIISDHYDRFPAFVKEVSGHIGSGKLKYRESVTQGLKNAPQAFIDLLGGGNFGKQLVRLDDPA